MLFRSAKKQKPHEKLRLDMQPAMSLTEARHKCAPSGHTHLPLAFWPGVDGLILILLTFDEIALIAELFAICIADHDHNWDSASRTPMFLRAS